MQLRTSNKPIRTFAPVYHKQGKFGYGIERLSDTEYRAMRYNSCVYGHGYAEAILPDQDAALAWCQADIDTLLGQEPDEGSMPVINNLDPNKCKKSDPALNVNVNGSEFDETTMVYFGGVGVPTTYVGQARVKATFDPVNDPTGPIEVKVKKGSLLSEPAIFTIEVG